MINEKKKMIKCFIYSNHFKNITLDNESLSGKQL